MAETIEHQPAALPARPPGRPHPGGPGPARARLGAFVRRHRLAPYLLLAPALAGIALVLLWPLVQVVIFSFQNYSIFQITGSAPTQWVGFANFTTTFTDPEFWLSLRNTVLLAVVVVPATLIAGTIVGLMLNRLGKKMAAFVSTAALMAWATPPISAAVLFYWLVSPDGGVVDWALSKLPHWLVGSTNWAQYNWTTTGAFQAYAVIAVLVVWQAFPFIAVSVLAGLKTIPAELIEAARVDGATSWRVFWRITYPLLKPIFLVLPAAVGDLGLQHLRAELHHHRLPRQPERVQPVAVPVRQGVREPAAQLRPRRRHRPDLRADPAGHHCRLRAHLGPAGGPDMNVPTLRVTPLAARPGYGGAGRPGPAAAPGSSRARTARRVRRAGLNGFGVLIALLTLFPLFWMLSTAFKPSHEIYSLTPSLLPSHPTLGNFRAVISGQVSGIGSVWLFFRNSLAVTLATVLVASLVSLLASVAVARFRFRFRASFLVMLLIVQMIPAQALIIALFLDFERLGLLQNLLGLIIVYAAQALPVSIWMLRNFVATIPRELEEAAAIDGANGFAIFWRILFPLVAPGLVATSIFAFITAYNEFIVALTFLGQAHCRLHAADLRHLFLRPRRRGVGPDHGRLHDVHHPGHHLLPHRQTAARRRTDRRSGEGMTQEIAADPAVGRLADAVLIPPTRRRPRAGLGSQPRWPADWPG